MSSSMLLRALFFGREEGLAIFKADVARQAVDPGIDEIKRAL